MADPHPAPAALIDVASGASTAHVQPLLHRPADLRRGVSIVIAVAGGLALANLPVSEYPAITPPAVTISINYPGASARWSPTPSPPPSSSRSTASPACSTCRRNSGNDGSYSLTVTFEIGTDLNAALVMVQNRVNSPCRSCRRRSSSRASRSASAPRTCC